MSHLLLGTLIKQIFYCTLYYCAHT